MCWSDKQHVHNHVPGMPHWFCYHGALRRSSGHVHHARYAAGWLCVSQWLRLFIVLEAFFTGVCSWLYGRPSRVAALEHVMQVWLYSHCPCAVYIIAVGIMPRLVPTLMLYFS